MMLQDREQRAYCVCGHEGKWHYGYEGQCRYSYIASNAMCQCPTWRHKRGTTMAEALAISNAYEAQYGYDPE